MSLSHEVIAWSRIRLQETITWAPLVLQSLMKKTKQHIGYQYLTQTVGLL